MTWNAETAKRGYSAIQFGLELETLTYRQKTVMYNGKTEHAFLYYQFTLAAAKGGQKVLSVVPDASIDIIFSCDPVLFPTATIYGSVLQGSRSPFRSGTVYFGVRLTPQQSLSFHTLSLRDMLGLQIPAC